VDLVEVEVKLNEFHTREMTDCQKWTICKCEGLQTEDLPLLNVSITRPDRRSTLAII